MGDHNEYSHHPFPQILYEMVTKESKELRSSIRWVCNGEAFVIDGSIQPHVNNILQKYFNHGRYSSLQRQLNMYGFKKHFAGKYEGAFFHYSFHRDKKAEVTSIKRRPPPGRNRGGNKLGTRKRKVKRRNSEASESSSLLREAALVQNNGSQETYYYGSDISTTNDNSTLGGNDNDDLDSLNGIAAVADNAPEPSNRSLQYGDDAAAAAASAGDKQLDGRQLGRSNLAEEKKKAPTNKIILPFSLKKVLLSTFENISQRQLVHCLPAAVSVRKILDSYVEAKRSLIARKGSRAAGSEDRDAMRRKKVGCKDMADGIALFFDKGLESRLLYSQELPQFKAMSESTSASGKRFSEVYGCEHLLRLLLRLPEILKEAGVVDNQRKRILHDIVEFVTFLHQHQESFFTASFRRLSHVELNEIGNDSIVAS